MTKKPSANRLVSSAKSFVDLEMLVISLVSFGFINWSFRTEQNCPIHSPNLSKSSKLNHDFLRLAGWSTSSGSWRRTPSTRRCSYPTWSTSAKSCTPSSTRQSEWRRWINTRGRAPSVFLQGRSIDRRFLRWRLLNPLVLNPLGKMIAPFAASQHLTRQETKLAMYHQNTC